MDLGTVKKVPADIEDYQFGRSFFAGFFLDMTAKKAYYATIKQLQRRW